MNLIKKTLDNGIRIAMIPQKKSNIVAVGFFINAGSRNESNDNNGVAHFLEHMLFRETKHRQGDNLFKELDMLGAEYNGFTTMEYSYYYIYGEFDKINHFIDLLLDIYMYPKFDLNNFNIEKKVIIEEMRMRNDSPSIKLTCAIHEKMFKGTALGRNIGGTQTSVNNISKRDLIKFHLAAYKPENTLFVVTGNFIPNNVYNLLKVNLKTFITNNIQLPSYYHEKSKIFKQISKQTKPYVHLKKNPTLNQAYVILVYPIYNMYQYKQNEIDLLTLLLSSGFSSRLTKKLREDNGLTYYSQSMTIEYSDFGMFLIELIINPDVLIKGIKIILKELDKIKNSLISDEELEKIINIKESNMIKTQSHPIDVLKYFGINLIRDSNFENGIKNEILKVKKITKNDIKNVASDIFIRDKLNIYVYGNIPNNDFSFLTS